MHDPLVYTHDSRLQTKTTNLQTINYRLPTIKFQTINYQHLNYQLSNHQELSNHQVNKMLLCSNFKEKNTFLTVQCFNTVSNREHIFENLEQVNQFAF